MKTIMQIQILLGVALSLCAQNAIDLSGTVTCNGAPVSNAQVTLIKHTLQAITDRDGLYSISAQTSAFMNTTRRCGNTITLKKDHVLITVNNNTVLSVTAYTCSGKKIALLFHGAVTSGPHTVPLPHRTLAPALYILQIQTGSEITYWKMCALHNSLLGKAPVSLTGATADVKTSEASYSPSFGIDTIQVTKDGYGPVTRVIDTLKGTFDITMLVADKIYQAAHVTPQPKQIAYLEMEYTMFVHFGINTFYDQEWGDGTEDPARFNPTEFDADQWVQVAKDAGFKMILLTTKHHDGFCLWPSALTDHDVAESPWRGGNGDVVKEVSDACKNGGIKFGVYLSPWDRHEPLFGTPEYNDFYKGQLTELLSNYGEITELWLDAATTDVPMEYDFKGIYALARELQPNIVIKSARNRYLPGEIIFSPDGVQGPDIRWVGNTDGQARESEMSTVGITGPWLDNYPQEADMSSRERIMNSDRIVWWMSESDISMQLPLGGGWFWHPGNGVRDLDYLVDRYFWSVGQNAVFLLNVPPDTRGLIPDDEVNRLMELKKVIDDTFDDNLALGATATASVVKDNNPAYAAGNIVDGDETTYWTTNDGDTTVDVEIDLGQIKTFNREIIQEYIRIGERVENFVLEAWEGNTWQECAAATTIGHKRILRFSDVTAQKVRIRITQSRVAPSISDLGLYRY